MSDDRSRDAGGPVRPGNVGPADPHADPATDPALRPVSSTESGEPTVPVPADPAGGPTVPVKAERPAVRRTRMSGVWIGLIGSALVLLLLLIFILQNLDPVAIRFLGATGRLPIGVALLFAAIAGVLLVAIPGSVRILQLRRAARRARPDAGR